MADQNITALPQTTAPEASDQLMIVGATEEKLIDYEKLADAILTKLTSKTFALNQGTMTLLQALNELNSKASESESYICSPEKNFEKALRNNKIVLVFTSPIDNSNIVSTGFGVVVTRAGDSYSGKYTEILQMYSGVTISLDGNNLKINSTVWLRVNIITL